MSCPGSNLVGKERRGIYHKHFHLSKQSDLFLASDSSIMPHVEVDLGAGNGAQSRPDALLRVSPPLYPALVILLSIFVVAPLTYPGSIQTQSGFEAAYNLMDLHANLGANLAWAPAFAHGYDLFRMDGPIPYFLAELFHLLGASFDVSIKLIYALGFVLSGLGMFFLGRTVFRSEGAGLLAGMVYVYFPYHVADVYVRGAFGEAAAWAVFPFSLLAVLNLAASPRRPRLWALALVCLIALGVLIMSGLGLLFGLGTAVASLVLLRRQPAGRKSALAIVGGVLLGFILLVPAYSRNQSTPGSFIFTPAFVYPFQFLTASWGTASPKGNYLDQFPYQLGFAAMGLTILAVALLFPRGAGADPWIRRIVLAALIAVAIALLLMTPIASPLWSISGATTLLANPFELLVFVGLALAISAGSVVTADTRFSATPMLAVLTLIPILGVYSYLAPEFVDVTPAHSPLARFNQDEIALVDSQIARPPGIFRHGATIELVLHWQALRNIDHDYTVFVHVVDENGQTWGSQDAKPQDGAMPTTQWQVGRVISDTHTVQIDLAGPPEGYHLEVGLYTAANGDRAPTETGATQVRIDENRE